MIRWSRIFFISSVLAFALASVGSTRSAFATPTDEEAFALLSRPLLRFAMIHTREGSALAQAIMSAAVSDDHDLRNFANWLSQEKWIHQRENILRRLEFTETELRTGMAAAGSTDETIARLGRRITDLLTLRYAPETGRVAFTAEIPTEHYATRRQHFMRADSEYYLPGQDLTGQDLRAAPLEGADLRFTSLRGTQLGDLTSADLRGADLRGAHITDDTNVRGAIYDQFTGLPFSPAEAAARGMNYRPSTPPDSFVFVNLRLDAHATGLSGARAPRGADLVPKRMLRILPEIAPVSVQSVRLFREPRSVEISGRAYVRFEAGVVESAPDSPFMTALIREIGAAGGEVRRLISGDPATGEIQSHQMAYFYLDGRMPVISAGVHINEITLTHEREHMRDWLRLLAKYRRRPGLTERQAFNAAEREWDSAAFTAVTERNAVNAELRVQAQLDNASGIPLAERRYGYKGRLLVYLASYPDLEGLGNLFRQNTLEEILADRALSTQTERLARRVIHRTLYARRSRYLHQGLNAAAEFTDEEFFHEAVAGNASRYAESGTLPTIQAYFASLLPSEVAQLPDDAFRRAIATRLTE